MVKSIVDRKKTKLSDSEKANILIIDDAESSLDYLEDFISNMGHIPFPFLDGSQALEALRNHNFDLIITDMMMPEISGAEILEFVKNNENFHKIPVLIISALGEMNNIVECIEKGAEDYLIKPYKPTILKVRINSCLSKKKLINKEEKYKKLIEKHNQLLEFKVREQVKEISSAQSATIFALAKLSESRDNETGQHLERMREYCKVLTIELLKSKRYTNVINESFIENIYSASPLHDIGKVGVEDSILLKPGRLSSEEFDRMKLHTVIGGQTLEEVNHKHPGNEFIKIGIDIAMHHHERWDGTGYPSGLAGHNIPLEARILALGDVYDALTSKRCYKEAFTHSESRRIISESTGSHFDPVIFEAFESCEKDFIHIRQDHQDKDEPVECKVS